jgi:hypothetical protein
VQLVTGVSYVLPRRDGRVVAQRAVGGSPLRPLRGARVHGKSDDQRDEAEERDRHDGLPPALSSSRAQSVGSQLASRGPLVA